MKLPDRLSALESALQAECLACQRAEPRLIARPGLSLCCCSQCAYSARPINYRARSAKRVGRSIRPDGDGVGNRLCGAVFHLRRERLRQRADTGGRQRNRGAINVESAEKISFAAGVIPTINPLGIGGWTERALLFSLRSRLVSPARPSSLQRPSWNDRSAGAHGRSRDATGSFIAAQRPVPDWTPAGPDRRHRRRQPSGRRRLSDISIRNRLPVDGLGARAIEVNCLQFPSRANSHDVAGMHRRPRVDQPQFIPTTGVTV